MLKYVLKRIAYMIVVFFTVSFLMYCLYNLIPEDPARMELEGLKTTLKPAEYQARYEQLREEMGLEEGCYGCKEVGLPCDPKCKFNSITDYEEVKEDEQSEENDTEEN